MCFAVKNLLEEERVEEKIIRMRHSLRSAMTVNNNISRLRQQDNKGNSPSTVGGSTSG